MSGRIIRDENSTSGILGSLAPRGEMTDNVYESDARDPGMDISGEGYDMEAQPERPYEGEVEAPSYSLREVNIKPLSSGYLVNVGCQSVAVETTETLLKTLGEYLNNPTEFERNWNRNKNRNKLQ